MPPVMNLVKRVIMAVMSVARIEYQNHEGFLRKSA